MQASVNKKLTWKHRNSETDGARRRCRLPEKWVRLTSQLYRSAPHVLLRRLEKKDIPGWLHAGVPDRQDRDPAPLFLPTNYLLMTACLLGNTLSRFSQRPHRRTAHTRPILTKHNPSNPPPSVVLLPSSPHTSLKPTHTHTHLGSVWCLFITCLLTLAKPFKPSLCDSHARKQSATYSGDQAIIQLQSGMWLSNLFGACVGTVSAMACGGL